MSAAERAVVFVGTSPNSKPYRPLFSGQGLLLISCPAPFLSVRTVTYRPLLSGQVYLLLFPRKTSNSSFSLIRRYFSKMASSSASLGDKITKLLKSRDKLEKQLSDLHVVIHEDLSSSTRRHSRVSRLLRSADDKLQECYDKNDELRKSANKTTNPEATIAELENWEAQLLAKHKTNTDSARQFIATSDPGVSAPSVTGTKSNNWIRS